MGASLLPGSEVKALRLWDLETGRTLRTLESHTGWVTAVALTADGRRAVSASEDRTLRVRDLKGADEITFIGEVRMCSCAVTPDGQTIVAGDASGHVHFLRIVEAYKAKPSIGDTARTS